MPGTRGFPRVSRLTQSRQFSDVFKRGVRHSSPPLVVHVLVNGGLGARLGLALSRRSLARSVDRNLVKRIAREAFRSIATSIPSSDIVLSFRGSAKSMDRAQVGAKIVTLLRQVR